MKAIQFVMLSSTAMAIFIFNLTEPAFSETLDLFSKEQICTYQHTIETVNMDKMTDMMDVCLKQADRVGVNGQQSRKLMHLHRELQKKLIRFKADQKIAEIDLMEIMEVIDFDLERAMDAIERSADLKTAHNLEMVTAMKEVRSILTVEQFNEISKVMTTPNCEKKVVKRTLKNKYPY